MDDLLTQLLESPPAPTAASATFAERMQQAKQQMTDLFSERTEGKNVWLVVLIDATSSMENYMRLSCGGVMSMFRALRHDLGCTLNVAMVAYRDPVDQEADRHDTFPFTDKQIVFQKQMREDLRCFGGGDDAEDVAGGLSLAVDMLRSVPRDECAILCHIADAPAHGIGGGDDRHNTEQQREMLATQLRALRDNVPEDFEYLYFPVGSSATEVCNLHRSFCGKHLGTEWVHAHMRVCKPNDFHLSFVSSIFESVTTPVSHTAPVPLLEVLGLGTVVGDATSSQRLGILRATVRDVQMPTDRKTFVRDLTAYTRPSATDASFLGSFMGFTRHMAPPSVDHAQNTDTVFRVLDHPMGQGAEHYVYRAYLWRNVAAATQEEMCTSADVFWDLGRSSAQCMVIKIPRVVHDPGFAESKMAVHVPAMVYADIFNTFAKRLGWTDVPVIRVVAPTVVSFSHGDVRLKKPLQSVFVQTKKLREYVLVAEPVLSGDFVKMWDNAGRRNSAAFEKLPALKVLHAYVLMCYVLSEETYVPSDLQGTLDNSKNVLTLTDLAATCANPLAFQQSRTNLGEPVLRKMVHDAYAEFKHDPKCAELFGPTGLIKHAHAILEQVAPMKHRKKRARA